MLEELVLLAQIMVVEVAAVPVVLDKLETQQVVQEVESVELDGNFQQPSVIQQWLQVIQLVQIHIKEVVV